MYAFSRILGDEEVLVVMNTSGRPQSNEMWVDGGATPAGTRLVDEFEPGFAVDAKNGPGGGSRVGIGEAGVTCLTAGSSLRVGSLWRA